MRKEGRAQGSAVYYSALTALAGQARHLGDEDAARRLTDEGHRIEETFTQLLHVFVSTRSVEVLASAPFYPDQVASTRRALDFAWESGSGGRRLRLGVALIGIGIGADGRLGAVSVWSSIRVNPGLDKIRLIAVSVSVSRHVPGLEPRRRGRF